MSKKVKLGEKYRDRLTGYEGVAVAQYTYVSGCIQYCLSRLDKDGAIQHETFDDDRLVLASSGVRARVEARKGGPARPVGRSAGHMA